MSTQKQRRDAARRHLERQVERRAKREAGRKKFSLVASIIGTLAVIALVIGLVVGLGGSDDNDSTASQPSASSTDSAADTAAPSVSPSASPSPAASTSYAPAKGAPVTYKGVTVTGAADLKGYPGVTSVATKDPAGLEYKDLVVGKGAAAAATSTVTVQYTGVLYKGGKEPFDSSWSRGAPAQFSLSGVVPGFTQGISGTAGVPAMKVGGRRLIIMPAALGYGAQANGDIPANSPLAFVVDLVSIDS